MTALGPLAEELALKPGHLLLEQGDAREELSALARPLGPQLGDV